MSRACEQSMGSGREWGDSKQAAAGLTTVSVAFGDRPTRQSAADCRPLSTAAQPSSVLHPAPTCSVASKAPWSPGEQGSSTSLPVWGSLARRKCVASCSTHTHRRAASEAGIGHGYWSRTRHLHWNCTDGGSTDERLPRQQKAPPQTLQSR
jgi:hypothetical protein